MVLKQTLIGLALLLQPLYIQAQVGIGTTNPDLSSVLEVSSSEKGLLFPRLTSAQRDAISNPAKGLIIYNTTEDCIQANSGTPSSPQWSCAGSSSFANLVNNCNANGFEGTFYNGQALNTSHKFSVTLTNNSFNTVNLSFAVNNLTLSGVGGITVNSVSPTSSTLASGGSVVVEYELTGTPSSADTLTGVWALQGLTCSSSVEMIPGDATFTLPQNVYVISIQDGSPLVDIQGIIDNSSNQLTVDIPYTSGFGSYNAFSGTYTLNNTGTGENGDINSFRLTYPAGNFSTSGVITATIEVDGDGSFNTEKQLYAIQETIATLDFQVNGISKGNVNIDAMGGIPDRNYADANHKFIYFPVIAADGNTWLNNNLGADYSNMNHAQFNPIQQATGFNDHHAYGSLFQWGRYSDGHELINYSNSTTGTPVTTTTSASHSTTTTPNNSTFYLGDDSPGTQDFNWVDLGASPNATEDGLWQGESGPNNPCPQGYRLPTVTEMTALVTAEGITNYTNAASSSIALSAPGYHFFSDGLMYSQSDVGYYWSSTVSGHVSRARYFQASATVASSTRRAFGLSVRCIKD